MDISDPLRPEVVSIWGLPWQKADGGDLGNNPMPHSQTCTLHGPPMIRGNRMFAAFWGGGIAIIDCGDLRDMKLRSEEHTSELQSLMRTSYAVFYLTKNNSTHTTP